VFSAIYRAQCGDKRFSDLGTVGSIPLAGSEQLPRFAQKFGSLPAYQSLSACVAYCVAKSAAGSIEPHNTDSIRNGMRAVLCR
jgi:hypothetical protein